MEITFEFDDFQNHIKNLLSEDQIKAAFDYIKSIEKELPSSLKSDILLIEARFYKADHDHIVGLINNSQYGVERVNIINSILNRIEHPFKPDSFISPTKKKFLLGILAFGLIAILAVLIPKIIEPNEPDIFPLTAIVHSSEGLTCPILRGQGEVSIDVGNDRRIASINENGEAVFLDLPGSFLGKKAVLGIVHNQPYTVIGNEKNITLEANKIVYLPVKLEDLESTEGQIFSTNKDDTLANVRVNVVNAVSYTDSFVQFKDRLNQNPAVSIPVQEVKQEISAVIEEKEKQNKEDIKSLIQPVEFLYLQTDIPLLESTIKPALFHDFKNEISAKAEKENKNNEDIESLIQLAELYISNKEYLKAEQQYLLAIKYDPSNNDLLLDLGSLYVILGEYRKSEKYFLECLGYRRSLHANNPQAYKPDLAMILNSLGILYSDLGNYSKSEIYYLECLEYSRSLYEDNPQAYKPDLAIILNNLGVYYYHLGDYNKSEKYYLESLEYYKQLQQSTGRYSEDVKRLEDSLQYIRSQMD